MALAQNQKPARFCLQGSWSSLLARQHQRLLVLFPDVALSRASEVLDTMPWSDQDKEKAAMVIDVYLESAENQPMWILNTNEMIEILGEGVGKEYVDLLKKLDAAVEQTGCIGMCHLEPIIDIYSGEEYTRYTKVNESDIEQFLGDLKSIENKRISDEDVAILNAQQRIVMRNYGKIDPESIDDYIATGGYDAIKKVLKEKTPIGVIGTIKRSGLRGRGGAGFPTGLKWELCRTSPGKTKYIVCNGDEGDPGAFMDRSVLEADPHAVIEGMVIGAKAIGAHKGFIYVRNEYPLAVHRIQIALEQAEQHGFEKKSLLELAEFFVGHSLLMFKEG